MVPPQASSPDWTDANLPYEQRLLIAEEDTRRKVSSTISALESAIEAWNAAGKQPESLGPTITQFDMFLKELDRWERESLLHGGSQDIAEREMRLMLFIRLCEKYRHLGVGGG